MRIISGELKGRSLYLPEDKNTRPLKDLARESIFNLLLHSNKISFQLEKSNVAGIRANLVRWPRKDGNDEVQSDSSVIDR